MTTDNEIRNITSQYIEAVTGGETVKQTYLRALVSDTIRELGSEPRANNAQQRKPLKPEEQERQLAAVAAVQARHAPLIDEVVDKSLEDVPAKERPKERNRRTNFARTAVYAVRRYIKAGKDLTALAPGRATKVSMEVTLAPRPATPRRLKGRVERLSKNFMAAVLELSEADQQAAVSELDTLIGQLANQLAALGVPAVRDPKKAVAEHRALQVGTQLFVPTATTILRQRANPS